MRKISRNEYFCFSPQISPSEDFLSVAQSCKDNLYSHCSLTLIFFFSVLTRERRESAFDHRDGSCVALKNLSEHFLHHLLPYWE